MPEIDIEGASALRQNSLRHALESVLPSRLYVNVRTAWRHFLRVKREGFLTAYNRRRLWPMILKTPPVKTDSAGPECDLSVHLMCYEGDYLSAIWALKSFYYHARHSYPLFLHLQGESSPAMRGRLREHFPNARVILQEEADGFVEPYLRERNCVRLLNYRKALPTVQKLTDFLIMAHSRKVVIFDSDVLFFRSPEELVGVDPAQTRQILFQRDFIDAYTIPPERAKIDFGIDMQSRINVGIVNVSPGSIDLTRCEEYLAHPEFANFEGHTEQTLWALEASRNCDIAYLPMTYLVSLEDSVDDAGLKARHYAGPSRGLMTRQGIPRLIRSGFLESLQTAFNGSGAKPSQPGGSEANFKQ